MAGVDTMALLLSLQCEMAEMKQKSEQEMCLLRQENEEMKKKLYGERVEKTKVITPSGHSKACSQDPEAEEEGSHHTRETSSIEGRRHPFVDDILSMELPSENILG